MSVSTDIKKELRDSLDSFSDKLDEASIDHFMIEAEELDNRDDIAEYHVAIDHGYRRPNIQVDSFMPYDTIQEYIVQLYVKSSTLKGSEGRDSEYFDSLADDIFDWIKDLAKNNKLYSITDGNLRVPKDSEGRFFQNQEEPLSIGNSKYTRFHIETVRK